MTQKTFRIEDIIKQIYQENEPEETKKSTASLFEAADSWKVFADKEQKPTRINDLIQAGRTNILDLSMFSSTATFNVRALIIGLISKKLFNQRILARKKEEIESIQHGFDKIGRASCRERV